MTSYRMAETSLVQIILVDSELTYIPHKTVNMKLHYCLNYNGILQFMKKRSMLAVYLK